jgi:hypothetical protein
MIRNVIKGFSIYLPSYPKTLVYMLQSSQYRVGPYFKWVWGTKDFTQIMSQHKLKSTKLTRLIVLALQLGIILELLAGSWLVYLGIGHRLAGGVAFGIGLIVIYPFLWAHMLVLPLVASQGLTTQPKSVSNSKKSIGKVRSV